MTVGRRVYRVLRSVLFTAIAAVVALYLALYILLSIPPIQDKIKKVAQDELTSFLGGQVTIGKVDIFPFNEVRLKDVSFYTPEKEKCISVGTLGAGIRLSRLLSEGKVEFTYAEILDLDGKVWQKEKDGPLNIAYIIEALAPKDKNKPPTKFDLVIHNIVIRRSSLSFDRLWCPELQHTAGGDRQFDPNHVKLTDLKADLTIPRLKNNDFIIDLRRLAFKSFSDFEVEKLSLKTHITENSLSLSDFTLSIGEGELKIDDLNLHFPSIKDIRQSFESEKHNITLRGEDLSPRDFRFFYPPLGSIKGNFDFSLTGSGNPENLTLDLRVRQNGGGANINLYGILSSLNDIKNIECRLDKLDFSIPSSVMENWIGIDDKLKNISQLSILTRQGGDLRGNLSGFYSALNHDVEAIGGVDCGLGDLTFDIAGKIESTKKIKGNFNIATERFDIGALFTNAPLGEVSLQSHGNIDILGSRIEGDGEAEIAYVDFKGKRISNIQIEGSKKGERIEGRVDIDDPVVNISANAEVNIMGASSSYKGQAEIYGFIPSYFGFLPKFAGYSLSGSLMADVVGNSEDNLSGELHFDGMSFMNDAGKGIKLKGMDITAETYEYLSLKGESINPAMQKNRRIEINTDFLHASADGAFRIKDLVNGVKDIISSDITSMLKSPKNQPDMSSSFIDLKCRLLADFDYNRIFKLPFKPLQDINLKGKVDLRQGIMECEVEAPYLLQGANKLITNSRLFATIERDKGGMAMLNTTYPLKNDRANVEIKINAAHDQAMVDLGWTMVNNEAAAGNIYLQTALQKNMLSGRPEFLLTILPSAFHLGPSEWTIDKSDILYSERKLQVDNMRIWRDNQFIEINGIASKDMNDEITVRLADIDLEYIFGILNINYVTFGGIARGEIFASSVFSKAPIARTRQLFVKDLSYNEAVLGDAEIFSCWNNDEKEVEIHADIKDGMKAGAKVDGGVYVTRDSLSFDMEANKVNIEFLKPFMAAFTSDVGGRASGKVKLFGTFKDIDLTGRVFADSIYMKVDYTNVYYHGSDSVFLNPGKIEIPSFHLYDHFGNSALLTGVVSHSYFHDPEFEFKIGNARNLLCYDTNSTLNPDWYGTIYASGSGVLKGRPGIVSIEMDMATDPKSDFTFVLSDTQTALDYTFLTFSDKRKESMKQEVEIEESLEEKFMRKHTEEVGAPSIFTMDLRVTVNPQARMNLIMDPNAGDKITAHGHGPLQIHYDTESDEMKIYGKYTLTEGNYNFSLQELILRDFKINGGSSISFNGDPLAANIDIVAAYRVNTNLSDLDKSFSTDRDLNRTNVPVDALLKVRGDLQNPEISFDISLPTLTSDVERKVRSIISTDDLMSRQIIYLLALNRFYTPEYMGSTSNGGELASVASSTISSQLSNIMGQLTDKFTVAPSFRSDKGDFSDMEVDVSLSSRLLNNRLLINGNFGYRDRSTSQTTFVGDFDLEYLLSRNGDLRLKAYNHFNDQNYYLKSSLTTQGIGIVYRKDFDNPLTWLRRKSGKKKIVHPDDPKIGPKEEEKETEKEMKDE